MHPYIRSYLMDKYQNKEVNKVSEQGSEQGKEQTTSPIISTPKGPAKDNPNERSPEEYIRGNKMNKGSKDQRNPLKLENPQTLHFPQEN